MYFPHLFPPSTSGLLLQGRKHIAPCTSRCPLWEAACEGLEVLHTSSAGALETWIAVKPAWLLGQGSSPSTVCLLWVQ